MLDFKVRIVSLLGALGICTGSLCAEEPHALDIAPLTQAQNDILVDSLRSSAVLALPPLETSQVVDPNISGIWAGSKVNVSLSLGEVSLRFRRKVDELVAATQAGQDLTRESLESLELVVHAKPYRMELRHSNPESVSDAQGVWVPLETHRPQTVVPFIAGQKNSGLYVAVLPTAKRIDQWAVFVCPRKVTFERKTGALGLSPSVYELFEAKVSAAAEAEAVMSTGGQEGRMKVSLHVSKDLPPSSATEDEAVSAVPRVQIKYKPQSPFDFFRFKPHTDVQQGILLMLEMQNKVGYVRKQHFSRYLYIHRTEEQTGVPVFYGNKRATADTGECYVLVEQANSWASYDKISDGASSSGGLGALGK
jgi:hypothetical protein